MIYLEPSEYPDTSQLIFQDDTPLDSFINEKQQRLLTTVFYSGANTGINVPFIVAANVGLFSSLRQPPVVPDAFLSLDVEVPQEWWERDVRSYLFWEFGKPPEIAIEIVSPTPGNELGSKLHDYAKMRIMYYVVYDPLRRLGDTILRVFELQGGSYIPKIDTWFPEVGLGLTVWNGVFEGINSTWLRLRYADGQVMPNGEEITAVKDAEISRKDVEISRKDAEISEMEQRLKRSLLTSIDLGLKLKFSAESAELGQEIAALEDLSLLEAIATNLPNIETPEQLRQIYHNQ